MDHFESAGIPVTVISMMPLRELQSRHRGTIELLTTWNDSELHETHVYACQNAKMLNAPPPATHPDRDGLLGGQLLP